MLTFAHLWILWLAPLPLLVWWLVPRRPRPRPAVLVPFLPRIRDAAGDPAGTRSKGSGNGWAVKGVVWLLVLVALARPQWLEEPIERTLPTRDLLLLVDLSASMGHEDFTNQAGETVDRLTAAKEVLGEFLTRRDGDRVGLVVFGNSPFLQAPFTTDLELSRQLLQETAVGMAGPQTALGDAIGLGIQLFEDSETPEKTIIALTDGNDTSSAMPPVEAARVARDREITIHTVAIGDPSTVGEEKLDQEALQGVAESTDGQFFLAMNREELAGIYDQLDAIETTKVETVSHRPRRDLYYLPLAVALVVSLLAQAWVVLRMGALRPATARLPRLRVDPLTFELKVTSE